MAQVLANKSNAPVGDRVVYCLWQEHGLPGTEDYEKKLVAIYDNHWAAWAAEKRKHGYSVTEELLLG